MQQYLELLRHILNRGERKPTRTREEGTLVPLDALSVFGYQMRFDLRDGFPLVTTKKVPFGAIVHELIWFLRGSTNVRYLQENKVTIWDEWADADGELGPVYGKQWRSWQCPDGRAVDQIRYVLDGIGRVKENPRDSVGRRLLVSAWNVADLDKMALAPCHTFFQFSVTGDRLDCQLYQRSADVFLGVPFNIASYALLTHLVARVTGLRAGEFIHTFGDVHIYENHMEQVRQQLTRTPYPLPRLHLDPALQSLDDVRFEHVRLEGYQSHPALRGKVAV